MVVELQSLQERSQGLLSFLIALIVLSVSGILEPRLVGFDNILDHVFLVALSCFKASKIDFLVLVLLRRLAGTRFRVSAAF